MMINDFLPILCKAAVFLWREESSKGCQILLDIFVNTYFGLQSRFPITQFIGES